MIQAFLQSMLLKANHFESGKRIVALFNFVDHMHHKLRANVHKGGWEKVSVPDLVRLMSGELAEFGEALKAFELYQENPDCNRFSSEYNALLDDIILEAADVANYCMMVADNLSRMKTRH